MRRTLLSSSRYSVGYTGLLVQGMIRLGLIEQIMTIS